MMEDLGRQMVLSGKAHGRVSGVLRSGVRSRRSFSGCEESI